MYNAQKLKVKLVILLEPASRSVNQSDCRILIMWCAVC